MRIMGIDPGLQRTGYGVIDQIDTHRYRLVEGGVVSTESDWLLEQRLSAIFEGIAEVIAEFQPDVAVVEKLYSKYRHPRTAILMGHARGAIYLAAARSSLEVAAYPASQVKKSLTGNGRATKMQVAAMVTQLLGLDETPSPADVTDALALAICHARPDIGRAGHRELPEVIRQAMTQDR
ncbi:MAG: crossover junction endodeoxyribonuclease RuvC [Armatimonadetes bacterium]|nr:crossover junction endodeoxyribonuclease RuvC [Armatimonadota bacterium]